MFARRIDDWDDAYANMPNIPNGEAFPEKWARQAEAFRSAAVDRDGAELSVAYGSAERQRYDLFRPKPGSDGKGLVVFVHGGYWMRFSNSYFSQLASGSLARGWSVAMPAYSLCPQVRIGQIVGEIGAAINAIAARVDGPIRLVGHSAGGHLVTRMICADTPLDAETLARIARVVSLSGVHDLRPLMRLALNDTLQLDAVEAIAESPAMGQPVHDARLACWVGGNERAEFLRQNSLLANIWLGLGAETLCYEEPDRHHFNVVDGLRDPDSLLCACLFG